MKKVKYSMAVIAAAIFAIILLSMLGKECPDCGNKMAMSDRTGDYFCSYCDEWK